MTPGEIAYLTTVVMAFVIFAATLGYETWRNER